MAEFSLAGNSDPSDATVAVRTDHAERLNDAAISDPSDPASQKRPRSFAVKLTCPIGERFGALVITGESTPSRHHRRWEARCDCGGMAIVFANTVRQGRTVRCQSCNLLERTRRQTTHGLSWNRERGHTPEYSAWQGMQQRCFNEHARSFRNYGGRGIRVCARWRDSFENFLADMGPRPSAEHSLDRINNDGDYCPENCRWATAVEQSNNRRVNRKITSGTETLTVTQWASRAGISVAGFLLRLKSGMSIEQAVAKPSSLGTRLITIGGETKTLYEWARNGPILESTVYHRLRKGWTPEEALTIPPRGDRRPRSA